MMNDPEKSLYKLYISKDLEIDQLERLNYGYGVDGSPPAPENPEIIKRPWQRKKNADGTDKIPDTKRTTKFLHWNILADKLTQNFDRVPAKFLDWKFRWKMMQ